MDEQSIEAIVLLSAAWEQMQRGPWSLSKPRRPHQDLLTVTNSKAFRACSL